MRKRIAIDMDETICDTLARHLAWYNKFFGTALTKGDMKGAKIYQRVPAEHLPEVKGYPDHPDFFMDIAPFEHAIEVIRQLHERFDIVIATAAMEHPNSFTAKYVWLTNYLPFLSPMNFIFCGKKSAIYADFLIDDSVRHFNGFIGTGILYTAPHNVNEFSAMRVNNWLEIQQLFLADPLLECAEKSVPTR